MVLNEQFAAYYHTSDDDASRRKDEYRINKLVILTTLIIALYS